MKIKIFNFIDIIRNFSLVLVSKGTVLLVTIPWMLITNELGVTKVRVKVYL